jgi:hypothetical protein
MSKYIFLHIDIMQQLISRFRTQNSKENMCFFFKTNNKKKIYLNITSVLFFVYIINLKKSVLLCFNKYCIICILKYSLRCSDKMTLFKEYLNVFKHWLKYTYILEFHCFSNFLPTYLQPWYWFNWPVNYDLYKHLFKYSILLRFRPYSLRELMPH